MSVLHVVVCYTVLAITVTSSIPRKQHCSSSSFTFSLTTSRNITGHWTSQVQLEHLDDETSLPWNIKVDHSSAQCDGMENVGLIATVSVPPPRLRRPDYQLLPGLGYYKLHTEAQTWNTALWTCLSEGTKLLVVNSAKEVTAVKDMWGKNPNFTNAKHEDFIHVGLHKGTDGSFVTDSGLPLSKTGYEVWDKNEPNNGNGNELCMSLRNTGFLHDFGCEVKLAFICEQEL